MEASDVAHIIQLAVAPVFLLAGIGGMLGVLTNRLGRIVDRSRVLERELPTVAAERVTEIHAEFGILRQRSRLINRAILLATATGLMVCLVVASLFVADLFDVRLSVVIAVFFIIAMSSFAGAFLFFLREILVATAGIRIGPKQKL